MKSTLSEWTHFCQFPAAFRGEQDVQMLTHLASCLIAAALREASELGFYYSFQN